MPVTGDVPACTAQDITDQINQMYGLGVRQMELVNKFDNALAGVAGDNGTTGIVVNGANFLETGTFWDMEHCEPADGESSDRTQIAAPEISPDQQDALFGALRAYLEGTFSDRVFVVSFVSNVLIASAIVYVGDQIGVGSQLTTAVVVVLGIRIFTNVAAIRRALIRA